MPTQIDTLINDYKNIHDALNKSIEDGKTYITLPNYTFTNSDAPKALTVSSPEECLNSLKNEAYVGGTFYDTSGNNCFLYKDGTLTSGTGTAIISASQYYNDKMNEISSKISSLFKPLPESTEKPLDLPNYPQTMDTYKYAQNIYNLSSNAKEKAIEKMKSSNLTFKVWILALLFVFFLMSFLFNGLISVFLFYIAIFVFLEVMRNVHQIAFTILLMCFLAFNVFLFFFSKSYFISFCILILGSIGCNYYINYESDGL